MTDSSQGPNGEDRAKRADRPRSGSGGSRSGYGGAGSGGRQGDRGRDAAPRRDGGKPWEQRDGDRSSAPRRDGGRPWEKRDGDRGSAPRPDGEKPWEKRDGDRGSAPRPDGEKPWEKRDGDRGSAPRRDGGKPWEKRDGDRAGGRSGGSDRGYDRRSPGASRPPREYAGAPAGLDRPRHDDPFVPDEIEPRDLDRGARAELKTLSKENSDWVARHLVAAATFLDDDPERAHQHALAASRRAGRVAVVRETLALTAYETGDFALALRELRTYRRISGSNDQLPLMVDSERGVGRPDRALELGRSVERDSLPPAVQVALAIAMSGARLDLGQPDLALGELEIPQLDPNVAFSYSPALFAAYAEVLEELGRIADAETWRARAERAEAALAGPADAEVFEVYDLDESGDTEPATPARRTARDAAAADAPPVAGTADAASGEAARAGDGDPADAIEPEVAALLAETDPANAASPVAEPAAGPADEDGADGPVPDQD
ncbi:hypothetical protein GE115_13135 [Agromyces sp. CFH 90414]|uniref:Primosomal protein n=1 Tax=Agromyces agglutinans TaxID=2662258 RepID=A0A6I2F7P5_9MICO|nr:hypothetical protein [Agromyces agglutinans]MRG60802.1 hypothetical protein [Agromyces agglutinans]